MYFILSIALIFLAIYNFKRQSNRLNPTALVLFALVSFMLGLYEGDHILMADHLKIFMYAISGFMTIIMPLFYLVLLLIVARDLKGGRIKTLAQGILTSFFSLTLLALIIITLWSGFNYARFDLQLINQINASVALYVAFLLLAYLILSIGINLISCKNAKKYAVILGAKLVNRKGGQVLIKRLNGALKYFENNEQHPIYIVTGGKPNPHSPSEASWMKEYLLEKGIPAHKIICEEEAKTTQENFYYVRKIIPDYIRSEEIIVFTSDFHLMRSAYYNYAEGLNGQMRATSSPWHMWIYNFIGDFLAYLNLVKSYNYLFILGIIYSEWVKFAI